MTERPVVLAVGRNPCNLELVGRLLGRAGYDVIGAETYGAVDAVLEEEPAPNAAVLDLTGMDDRVWERCERLRRRGVPFLIVAGRRDERFERLGLARGASAVLFKPLRPSELLLRVGGLAGEAS